MRYIERSLGLVLVKANYFLVITVFKTLTKDSISSTDSVMDVSMDYFMGFLR